MSTITGILEELRWRGQLSQVTDEKGLAAHLAAGPQAVYAGFDPTADSLQIGNLVPLLVLVRFQRAGHRPIALVGGGTGLIGDPGGKKGERELQAEETVRARAERFREQLGRFLDLDSTTAPAQVLDNAAWLRPLSAIELLRDVGKHFPLNVMLRKESVRTRLEAGGISYTEFSYMVLQAFDHLELLRRHGCRIQVGGDDQWGNITAGVDLIRRVGAGEAFAITHPLVTTADGEKFGKTADGAIWLDPARTSPFAFYQFWLQAADSDVVPWLRTFSFLDRDAIDALTREVAKHPERRAAQQALADAVTTLVHGAAETARARATSEALFGRGALRDADVAELERALKGAPTVRLDPAVPPPPFARLLVEAGLARSISEAGRLAAGGGVYVNDERLEQVDVAPADSQFLGGRLLVLRRGKRSRALVLREP